MSCHVKRFLFDSRAERAFLLVAGATEQLSDSFAMHFLNCMLTVATRIAFCSGGNKTDMHWTVQILFTCSPDKKHDLITEHRQSISSHSVQIMEHMWGRGCQIPLIWLGGDLCLICGCL